MGTPAEYRVVLIDDNPDDITILHNAIHRSSVPIELKSFTSAQQALAYLRSGPAVHLVITDYEMPGLSGVEFLRQLGRDDALRTMPVAVMSGSAEMRLPQRWLADIPYFTKPDTWHGYQRLVRELHATLVKYAATPQPGHHLAANMHGWPVDS